MNHPLPTWAANPEGRALVDQIIAERPDYFIRSGTWIEGGGIHVYKGKTAGQLRRLYNAWLDRELAALNAQYEVTGHWDQDASNALFGTEDGNALIERLLRETEDVKALGGGRYQVAA